MVSHDDDGNRELLRKQSPNEITCSRFSIPVKIRVVWNVEWYWDRTHDMPAMVGYLNHWATAALKSSSELASTLNRGSSP
ncbi:hypothetical protein TNCV_3803181 [Trichonephila clavipes]|nr:hypothetical protein TNCV_3803181 [Trichonephila clavipes]